MKNDSWSRYNIIVKKYAVGRKRATSLISLFHSLCLSFCGVSFYLSQFNAKLGPLPHNSAEPRIRISPKYLIMKPGIRYSRLLQSSCVPLQIFLSLEQTSPSRIPRAERMGKKECLQVSPIVTIIQPPMREVIDHR